MKNCKRLTILLILLMLIATMSTLFVACNKEEPYYGTYYGGYPDNQNSATLTIDKEYVYFGGEQSQYTYSGNTVTLTNGLQIKIVEANQVAYIDGITDSRFNNKIKTRNGNFSATIITMSNGSMETGYYFYSNGTFEILKTSVPASRSSGKYYLKNGVLSMITQEVSGLIEISQQNILHFWYIDANYIIYPNAMVKDYTKFQTSSTDKPSNTPDDGNNGNNGNNSNNGNGSSQEKTYTVVWKNYEGTVLEVDYDVPSGTVPTYDGNTPTRVADDNYVYTFDGWSPSVSSIYEDTIYTAQFSSILSYTVTWKNYDGTVLETDYNVPRGSTPTYDGNTPTRAAEEEGYNYTFKGWSPSVSSIYEDKTYTAQFEATLAIPDLPANTQPLLETANTSFEGDGTEESPYLIKTSAQLLGMGAYADKHFALANDITLPLNSEDRPNFSPLFSDEKPFNATFDGRGYTVSNLYIYNTDTHYTGLFASVGESGVVKNLKLADVRVFGGNYIGGIAGLSIGSIKYCEVNGNITYVPANNYQVYVGGIAGRGNVDKCNSAVEIKVFDFNSNTYVGGLTGYSTSEAISDSSNTGNIIVKTTDKNSNSYTRVGGLVGDSSSSITSSYNTGNIAVESVSYTYVGGLVGDGNLYSSIKVSYNTGDITVEGDRDTYVGGLVGSSHLRTIISSYNTGDITVEGSRYTYVGGLVGERFSSITNSYNTGDITVEGSRDTRVGGLMGSGDLITSSYNTGKITVNSNDIAYIGGLAGYGDVTLKNSHWLYFADGSPVNAVGYNSGMGVPTNIGATKYTAISEFYDLADILNDGLKEPVFEHKTSSSLPTLIKKEN
ncbi:MAG: hypothetical protein K2O35_06465 [Clostridia bacterium]|nr:hypothetical protein [Clostridia bacterium]